MKTNWTDTRQSGEQDACVTDALAVQVMGWKVAPDRFIKSGRSWIPRWRFRPFAEITDAFQLLDRVATHYRLVAIEGGGFTVEVGVGIDDFAPQGSSADVARYHAAADRVFRAAGNHAGRSRLDSTAKLREPKPPRALVLSTGEDVPRGQSVRARLLILELSKNGINVSALTARQKDAQDGLYTHAMGGFVQWLAAHYEERRAWLDQKTSEYRARAMGDMAHARTPDIVANLQAAFELYLWFGVECRVLNDAERDRLASRCWDALRCAAAAQAKHQASTEPAAIFLTVLRSLFTAGRAYLEARSGGIPERLPESCGWKRDNSGNSIPRGECIGWVFEDDIYLDPSAAYRVAQLAGRGIGEILEVSEQTLRKRLHEKRLLASIDEARQTLTVRRSICGSSKSVLHFLRSTILPEVSDGDEDAE